MSDYINAADWTAFIREDTAGYVTQQDLSIRDTAEEMAVQQVRDALYPYYDVDGIFAKTGDDRDKNVFRWVMCLALYHLYRRVPDVNIPDRVVTDYDDIVEILRRISDGKMSVQLDRLTDADGVVLTKFQYGSMKKQRHD